MLGLTRRQFVERLGLVCDDYYWTISEHAATHETDEGRAIVDGTGARDPLELKRLVAEGVLPRMFDVDAGSMYSGGRDLGEAGPGSLLVHCVRSSPKADPVLHVVNRRAELWQPSGSASVHVTETRCRDRPHTDGVRYLTLSQAYWIGKVCAVISSEMRKAEEAGKRVEAGLWVDLRAPHGLTGYPWIEFRNPVSKPKYCRHCGQACRGKRSRGVCFREYADSRWYRLRQISSGQRLRVECER